MSHNKTITAENKTNKNQHKARIGQIHTMESENPF